METSLRRILLFLQSNFSSDSQIYRTFSYTNEVIFLVCTTGRGGLDHPERTDETRGNLIERNCLLEQDVFIRCIGSRLYILRTVKNRYTHRYTGIELCTRDTFAKRRFCRDVQYEAWILFLAFFEPSSSYVVALRSVTRCIVTCEDNDDV